MRDYVQFAIRTESVHPNYPRLLHAAMGIITELDELVWAHDDANLKEELGDVCWYLAIAVDALELSSFADLGFHQLDDMHDMTRAGAAFMDQMKTHLFYNRELDKTLALKNLQTIAAGVRTIAEQERLEMDDILHTNIQKLQRRYPEGFTDYRANNRDE